MCEDCIQIAADINPKLKQIVARAEILKADYICYS